MDLYSSLADQYAPDYDFIQALEGRGQESAARKLAADAIRLAWADFLARERAGVQRREDLHLYIHIPFCNQVCSFCCYYTVALTAEERLEAYLDWLAAKLEYFAPTFADRPFQTLYFGGGTPSILSPKQIDRLLGLVRRLYKFQTPGEATFEFNPESVTREKLDVIASHGINRVSMGVQSFEPESLSAENRGYQTMEMVNNAVSLIQEGSRFALNLDLIMGLREDDSRAFLDSMRRVMRLNPDQFCVYPLYPTPRYLNITTKKIDMPAYYQALAARYAQVAEEAKAVAAEHSYFASNAGRIDGRPWLFMVRRLSDLTNPSKYKGPRYSDVGTQSRLLFGVGPTARSRIAGALSYEEIEGIESHFDPAKSAYSGQPLDERREMIGYILRQLRTADAVSLIDFRDAFGRDLRTEFAESIEILQRTGAVQCDDSRVTFSSNGRTRFLAVMQLCERPLLERMLVTEIAVRLPEPLTFQLSWVDPNQKYLATTGNVALVVKEETRKREPDPKRVEYQKRLIKLFTDVFRSLGERRPGLAIDAFMTEYVKFMDHYLGPLRKEGQLGRLELEVSHPRT